MHIYLGVDWGGTFLKAGLVDEQGRVLRRFTVSSHDFSDKKLFFPCLEQIVEQCPRTVKGIGIGAPGIVNPGQGLIYYLPNVAGWKNYPLARQITKITGLPAKIDNDANVFALAEARFGAARGYDNALFLTLGTGLGGAIMIDKKIVHGKTSAGELGHFPVAIRGRQCGCGGRGCVETFVGNRYLLEMYNRLQKNKKKKVADVKTIYERALGRDPRALKVWEHFSLGLGSFLAGMINVFNPQVIVLGGGVSGAFRVFKPMLKKIMKEQAMWPQLEGVKLVKARVKDPAVIGAALLVKETIQGIADRA